jgi:molybdenum cofactor cytidylyltransferase
MAVIAAVVLAAGASSRFGAGNKLLAEIGGKPLLRIVAEAVAAAGISDIVVVTGSDRASVETALAGLGVRFAHNPGWQSGMGTSIAAGVSALGEVCDGAFIVPGDMPLLSASVLESLIAAFEREGLERIVYAATPKGEQRNPVLWPRRYFAELAHLSGREGAKRLLRSLADESVAVAAHAATLADIDTSLELQAAVARLGSSAAKLRR